MFLSWLDNHILCIIVLCMRRNKQILVTLCNFKTFQRQCLSRKLFFLSPPRAIEFVPLAKVSASKVPVIYILKKFASNEAQNLNLEATIMKLYLVARPCFWVVILSNPKLAETRQGYSREF